MENAADYCVVYVTTDTNENAKHIAKIIVSEKLAACCTVIPNVNSYFSWQGTIIERQEFFLVIKTLKEKTELLESRICELHPDEVPEIISLAIDKGFPPYLEWMKNCLSEE